MFNFNFNFFLPSLSVLCQHMQVTNVREAIRWLSYTYLYTRMTQVGQQLQRRCIVIVLSPTYCCAALYALSSIFLLVSAWLISCACLVPVPITTIRRTLCRMALAGRSLLRTRHWMGGGTN